MANDFTSGYKKRKKTVSSSGYVSLDTALNSQNNISTDLTGTVVQRNINPPGPNRTVDPTISTDSKITIDSTDKNPDFLINKIEPGNGIGINIDVHPNGSKALKISSNIGSFVTYSQTFNVIGNINGDAQLVSNDTFLYAPTRKSSVKVYVNGDYNRVAIDETEVNTRPCFFKDSTGTIIRRTGEYQIGDKLYWNTLVATYPLDNIDKVVVEFTYENNL
jgi:hypothetical protein